MKASLKKIIISYHPTLGRNSALRWTMQYGNLVKVFYFFCWSKLSQCPYHAQAVNSLKSSAEAQGIKLEVITINADSEEEKIKKFNEAAAACDQRKDLAELIVTCNMNSAKFHQGAFFTSVKTGKKPELLTLDYPTENMKVNYVKYGFKEFNSTLENLVAEVCSGRTPELKKYKAAFEFETINP